MNWMVSKLRTQSSQRQCQGQISSSPLICTLTPFPFLCMISLSLTFFSLLTSSPPLHHWLIPLGCRLMLLKSRPPTRAWGYADGCRETGSLDRSSEKKQTFFTKDQDSASSWSCWWCWKTHWKYLCSEEKLSFTYSMVTWQNFKSIFKETEAELF